MRARRSGRERLRVLRWRGAYILLGVVLLVSIASVALAAPAHDVVVELTDGTRLKGSLLSLTVESVKIDPEGPVSLRLIPAEEVVSLELDDGEVELTFPWTRAQIPEDLGGGTAPVGRSSSEGLLEKRTEGVSSWCFTGDLGRANAVGEEYYEGFDGGLSFGLRVRYNFTEHSPHARHWFLSTAYRRSSMDLEGSSGLGIPGVTCGNLGVQHWAIEFGTTTPTFGNGGSYAYGLFGIGGLWNAMDIEVDWGDDFTFTDAVPLLRFTGGCVIGVTPTWGAHAELSWDVVYGGTPEEDFNYSTPSGPQFEGSIFVLSVGVTYSL